MTTDEIKLIPIVPLMQERGYAFQKAGAELACLCPFHADKSPSFRVNLTKNLWTCDPCHVGGSVIDLVMKLDNLDLKGAIEALGGSAPVKKAIPIGPSKEVCHYDYRNENGDLAYQVVRYEPKTFRQRRMVDGVWNWKMDGVKRVLYRLPEVLESQIVCIVEGEKDVETLFSLGMVATCNVGGAGKWLEAYSEHFNGKDVILCPDNDDPGRKHMEDVAKSLEGKVKSLRKILIPPPHKDASDFITSFPTKEEAAKAIMDLSSKAKKIHGGIDLPIESMGELENSYQELMAQFHERTIDLSCWLPGFKKRLRPLVPGEVVAVVADTSAGKTTVLQNIAMACNPVPTLLFEMELPGSLTFERFLSLQSGISGAAIEKAYSEKRTISWREKDKLSHIFTCSLSKLTIEKMEELIIKAPLKMGKKPVLVMLDYLQLMRGKGNSRYEKTSEICEELKTLAKSTGTIIIFTSQISRKKDEGSGEIFLHDGKDSGSVESSAGIMIGVWRDKNDDSKMMVKLCKQTKGERNFIIPCRFYGETLTIKEDFGIPFQK